MNTTPDAIMHEDDAPKPSRQLFGHPSTLFTLSSSEMWERFSFYTMRNLLTLYMVNFLLFGDTKSTRLYGLYNTLVYITPLVGGFLADRILGYRRSILFGGILMALGQFCLGIPVDPKSTAFFVGPFEVQHPTFYLGLCLLIIGNGFFKPNISSIVGNLYSDKDVRRDRAYAIFYMGINVGALLSSISAGTIQKYFGWNLGFICAGVGMLIGIIIFMTGTRTLGAVGSRPDTTNPKARRQEPIVYIASLVAVPLVFLSFSYYKYMDYVMFASAAAFLIYLGWVASTLGDRKSVQKLLAAVILMFMSVLFWSFFEQAGTSLQLFTDRNLNHTLFGFEIPSATINNIFNPLFVVALSVPFSAVWGWLQRKNLEPSSPMKFAIGIIMVGLGFYTFVWGGRFAQAGLVPMVFLIGGYLWHTLGELCLSPVGLSTISKLSPLKIIGVMMGAWFLASAFGQYLAAIISTFASVDEGSGAAVAPEVSLAIYLKVFQQIGTTAIIAGIVLAVLSPFVRKLMHDVK
jgi:POT family proton-dependent oligopeptide transporter